MFPPKKHVFPPSSGVGAFRIAAYLSISFAPGRPQWVDELAVGEVPKAFKLTFLYRSLNSVPPPREDPPGDDSEKWL